MSKEEIINELQKITKLLTLAYSDKIEEILTEVASTKERKIVWVLLDGKTDNKELQKITGLAARSVRRILNEFESCDLINNPWGKPASRKIDYVPSKWIELLPKETEDEDEQVE